MHTFRLLVRIFNLWTVEKCILTSVPFAALLLQIVTGAETAKDRLSDCKLSN